MVIVMDGIFACDDRDAMPAFAADWDRLAAAEPVYTLPFSDFDDLHRDDNLRLRLVGRRVDGQIVQLAVLYNAVEPRAYWLGPKRIMSFAVRTARLFGGTIVGAPDQAAAAAMLATGLSDDPIDLLVFEDLPVASAVMALTTPNRLGGTLQISRHNTARRLIDLPSTMDAYWASLRTNTRKTAQRDLRYFMRHTPEYRYFTGADAIDVFLPAAASLSARSYQSGLGFGLKDDARTRTLFEKLARQGRLRCYLASVEKKPVAFAWGDIAHGVFYFRMTGYDPGLAQSSAGKAIMFEVIRDLIETRAAKAFDFGVRDMPYKERFSTKTVDAVHLLVSRNTRGWVALMLDRGFDAIKTGLPRLIGTERLARIKRRLRG